jgi:hypothetical protein
VAGTRCAGLRETGKPRSIRRSSGAKIQRVRRHRRCLSVFLLVAAVAIGCGSSGKGRVLAEGKHLGEFEASPNPFKFDAAHARRFVITKVEVFGPGQLNGFPGACSGGSCAATPDKWPIVIISTEREPGCERLGREFAACLSPLSAQCGMGEESSLSPTYIWWERDSAGHRKRHSCAYFGIEHPSDLTLMGFVPHVSTPPTSFSLVVQGRDVPIRLTPARSQSAPTSSGRLPAPRTSPEPVAVKLCKKPGIRYAGTTAEGSAVCFTLSSDRSKWLEIGFRFDPANCLGTGEKYYVGPNPLISPGRITVTGFTATIRGARASGVLEESFACRGKTFKWTAHRVP